MILHFPCFQGHFIGPGWALALQGWAVGLFVHNMTFCLGSLRAVLLFRDFEVSELHCFVTNLDPQNMNTSI